MLDAKFVTKRNGGGGQPPVLYRISSLDPDQSPEIKTQLGTLPLAPQELFIYLKIIVKFRIQFKLTPINKFGSNKVEFLILAL